MTTPSATLLATAHLDSGTAPYTQSIRVGHHAITADEPAALGGGDTGPTPYQLLLASLAACTAITLKMYAARKGWDLGALRVDLAMHRVDDVELIDRALVFAPSVTAEQRARLAEIAEKTPVTKTIKRGATIVTTVA